LHLCLCTTVVLCGDFFQLPPVNLKSGAQFLFEARAWQRLDPRPVVLTRVFRQRDAAFVNLLNEMRRAQLTPFSIAQLNHQVTHPPLSFQIDLTEDADPKCIQAGACMELDDSDFAKGTCAQPTASQTSSQPSSGTAINGVALPTTLSTRLFAHNEAADRENDTQLHALACSSSGANQLHIWLSRDEGMASHVNSCIAPQRLSLRIGAQVMLLKNLDQAAKLVNGTRGIVVSFEHLKSSERLKGVSMHPGNSPPLVPKVSFQVDPSLGAEGWLTKLVYPEEWTTEEAGKSVASRTQVPLKLAWAISIVSHLSLNATHVCMTLHIPIPLDLLCSTRDDHICDLCRMFAFHALAAQIARNDHPNARGRAVVLL
jgi:ATP-dependent DNA helicase PIF1